MGLLTAVGKLLYFVHPEITHRLSSLVFSIPLPTCKCETWWDIGGVKTCGPVGVAAGLDKTGKYARFLSFFCPGFVVVGSTTPRQRVGNKPPRVARLRPYSLVNAMGLNSPGISRVVSRVTNLKYPIFISIAGFTVRDFLIQLEYLKKFKPTAIELNISSPTYEGLWRYAPEFSIDIPTFVKIGPAADLLTVVKQVEKLGWGLVVTNTIPTEDRRLSTGVGGVSGLLIYKYGLRMLEKIRTLSRDIPIIYSGGVFTCSQVRQVLRLANGVEVLTAVLYFTPVILRSLNQCIDKRLQ